MKKLTKVVGLFIALIMLASMLVGCASPAANEAPAATGASSEAAANNAAEPASEEEAASAGTTAEVIVAIGADPADLSPFNGMSLGRIAVLKTTYEYLLEADSMGTEAVPMMAKSVEKTGDKTYVVTIYDYITDSAGNHITASDVVFSFTQGMEVGQMRPLGNIESITALDDYSVEYVFKTELGVGDLDKTLTECPVVSQAAYEASDDKFSTNPVATGPYVVTDYVPGSSLTYEKRADYWQTPELTAKFSQSNVEKIVFQVITEPAQHAIALESGTANISANISGDDIDRFVDNPDYNVFKFQDNLTWYMAFNGSEDVFGSKDLRQAIAYAIDTTAICAAVAPGSCNAAHTIGNSNFGSYNTDWDSQDYYSYDLDKAKELFAASGHEAGELSFTILFETNPKTALVAQVIQNQLAELGIEIVLDQEETSVFNNMQYDPTQFDILIGAAAGGDFVISPWLLIFDQNRNNGTTWSFVVDDELQSLLMATTTIEGYTSENINAFNEYQTEQVYTYGLLSYMNNVVTSNNVVDIVRDTRGQIMPGACGYAE